MAKIKAFKAWRPVSGEVAEVASRPYDVINTREARKEAEGFVHSFLHVVKPEIDFPDEQDPYANEVYEKGVENFQQLIDQEIFLEDEDEYIFLYELIMNGKSQTGIMACASVDDYFNNVIKKHELTRPDKEEDRKQHVRYGKMHAEPVFFAYRKVDVLDEMVERFKREHSAIYDFTARDGIQHKVWKVYQPEIVAKIISLFETRVPATYVADGHHRTAAAALVGREWAYANAGHNGTEAYNYFLAVHFPDTQLQIIDYNRVVKDLNGLNAQEFLKKIQGAFEVINKGLTVFKPRQKHEFGMYLEGSWYQLIANENVYDDGDALACLDVTVLSEQILDPILNIKDLRTDKRIDFVGGIRGMQELQNRVDNGEMKVAFALYPVSMEQLMDIADQDLIMPPKTTWFEPKLRSGLAVHRF